MKNNPHQFKVPIASLKQNVPYHFSFTLNQNFFNPPLDNLTFTTITVNVDITKEMHLFFLKFYISIHLTTPCDRCTSMIDLNLMEDYQLIIKKVTDPHGANDTETDPDIFYISFNDYEIDLKIWIKDFILLSIPDVKKCLEEGKGAQCNQEVLKKINGWH